MLIFSNNTFIDNFNGLWGWYLIPKTAAIPFTIFAAVGIINSINLIDGVNGLSSGYCIMASAVFGILFYMADNVPMTILATVSIGSLIPFFLHNVFGKKSKMFIGDGGTLMMGAALTCCTFKILSKNKMIDLLGADNFGAVAFCVAVLGIPIFDTLRVMCTRILKGGSPFAPDKTHLHHLFIDLGFSHIGCGTTIICMNMLNVAIWYLLYKLGASIDIQFYVVIAMGILLTFGFNHWIRFCIKKANKAYQFMLHFGKLSHIERTGFWFFLQNLMDGKSYK
jgi:UDP-N-acetylmuramyl pentapeptide phosphotransferase/UDP-N-acetylglucosamine-1-phosphate transferase